MLIIDQPKTDFKSLFLKYNQSPQGIYIFEGFSISVGVLPYLVEVNGKSIATGILTSDTELFNPNSLDSLIGAAVIKEHPENFNADLKDMGGIVLSAFPGYADNPSFEMSSDVLGLSIKIAVWSEELLDYISSGNSELSAGYTADIIEKEGTWHGSPYSYIKTNIIYDHLAVVEKGSARNGSKSSLLTDDKTKYQSFKIITSKTKKLTDSITVSTIGIKEDFTENSNDNADVKKSSDIIENELSPEKISMKQLVTPSGKIVQLADDIYQIISDDFDNLIREKQSLEKTATTATKLAEDAEKQVTDSKTKEKELGQKIEESTKKFSKAVAIAAKAEKLGVVVDYSDFDASATMREALKTKYPDIDTVSEDTLFYLFNLAEIPIQKDNKKEDEDNAVEGDQVTDSITSQVKKSVKNEKKSNIEGSSEEMSRILAEKRRTRTSK